VNTRPNERVTVALDLLSKGNSPSVVVSRLAAGWGGRSLLKAHSSACSEVCLQRAEAGLRGQRVRQGSDGCTVHQSADGGCAAEPEHEQYRGAGGVHRAARSAGRT